MQQINCNRKKHHITTGWHYCSLATAVQFPLHTFKQMQVTTLRLSKRSGVFNLQGSCKRIYCPNALHSISFYYALLWWRTKTPVRSACSIYCVTTVSHHSTSARVVMLHLLTNCTSVPLAAAIKLNDKNSSKQFPCCWHSTEITFCCILHHNRNLKHVVLASLWQHKFAARHVVSVVQSGAPKTRHSRQLSWKPIDLFRTLKTSTHSKVISEP